MKFLLISFFAIYLIALSNSQLPDFTIIEASLAPYIDNVVFAPLDCDVVNGCALGSGSRTLLRFTTQMANIGSPIQLGNQTSNPVLFNENACSNTWELTDLNAAVFLTLDGNVTSQSIRMDTCISDDVASAGTTNPPVFTCSYQGLSTGYMNVIPATSNCQYVDITGVAPGTYWLRVEVNANQIIVESNYTNNVAWFLYTLTAPVSTPTPTATPTAAPPVVSSSVAPTMSPSPKPQTSPSPSPDEGGRQQVSAANRISSFWFWN